MGLQETDVADVMAETSCTRGEAEQALRDNDSVTAAILAVGGHQRLPAIILESDVADVMAETSSTQVEAEQALRDDDSVTAVRLRRSYRRRQRQRNAVIS